MTEQQTRTDFIATEERPYHFLESGLTNIYLVGIRCVVTEGDRIIPEIPAVKQLLQLIARDIIEQPTALTGDQIRFLRKRLGKKQTDFARDIGLEAETLSRCENGRQSLGEPTDKLVRLYYAFTALDDAHLNQVRTEIHKMLSAWREQQALKRTVAKVTNDEWQLQTA